MVGSSLSAATTNIVLNTIVADSLSEFANELEPLKYIQDVRDKALEICQRVIREHKRILFSGDGYSKEWIKEAEGRGLPNIPAYIYSIESLVSDKAIGLFERNKVLSEVELKARADILYEQYYKKVLIESNTLMAMTKKTLLPALIKEIKFYSDAYASLNIKNAFYETKIDTLLEILGNVQKRYDELNNLLTAVSKSATNREKGYYAFETIVSARHSLRKAVDRIESEISKENFPVPSYEEMFISIL